MWYNKHIGEEVKITEFAYYSNGQNYSLNGDIKNIQDILTCVKKYGPLNLHARRLNHSDWFQIHLEDTNYKQLIRKTKLKNLK